MTGRAPRERLPESPAWPSPPASRRGRESAGRQQDRFRFPIHSSDVFRLSFLLAVMPPSLAAPAVLRHAVRSGNHRKSGQARAQRAPPVPGFPRLNPRMPSGCPSPVTEM